MRYTEFETLLDVLSAQERESVLESLKTFVRDKLGLADSLTKQQGSTVERAPRRLPNPCVPLYVAERRSECGGLDSGQRRQMRTDLCAHFGCGGGDVDRGRDETEAGCGDACWGVLKDCCVDYGTVATTELMRASRVMLQGSPLRRARRGATTRGGAEEEAVEMDRLRCGSRWERARGGA